MAAILDHVSGEVVKIYILWSSWMSSLFRFSFIIKETKPGKPEKRPFDENLTINVTDKYLMSTDLDAKIVLS